MPFNLLLFPIVGGYYFIIRYRYLRYYHQRVDSQRLLFNSIIAGTFLLFISFIITTVFVVTVPELISKISKMSPVTMPFFFTTLGSFVLGILLSEGLNIFTSYEKAIISAIKRIGNEFELLLESSWNAPHLIQLTLKNNKVYIGWLKTLPVPGETIYVSILPVLSGYREAESKKMHLTTQYLDVYASYIKDGEVTDLHELTNLVIKVDEILTAGEFDIDMYDRFLKQDTVNKKSPTTTSQD